MESPGGLGRGFRAPNLCGLLSGDLPQKIYSKKKQTKFETLEGPGGPGRSAPKFLLFDPTHFHLNRGCSTKLQFCPFFVDFGISLLKLSDLCVLRQICVSCLCELFVWMSALLCEYDMVLMCKMANLC